MTAKLLAAQAEIKQAISDALEQGGKDMEEKAKQLVPVRTGRLQASIYHQVDGLQLELGARADYAADIEFGHNVRSGWKIKGPLVGHVGAQPFIRPAADEGQPNLLSLIRNGILWAFQ